MTGTAEHRGTVVAERHDDLSSRIVLTGLEGNEFCLQ
jgi:hypothetical protein